MNRYILAIINLVKINLNTEIIYSTNSKNFWTLEILIININSKYSTASQLSFRKLNCFAKYAWLHCEKWSAIYKGLRSNARIQYFPSSII